MSRYKNIACNWTEGARKSKVGEWFRISDHEWVDLNYKIAIGMVVNYERDDIDGGKFTQMLWMIDDGTGYSSDYTKEEFRVELALRNTGVWKAINS